MAEDSDWIHWQNAIMTASRREFKAVLPVLLPALLLASSWACALDDDVTVVGLSQGRAVVLIGNSAKPKVVRDGDTLSNGARLIKATPESAIVEINGKRQTLTLGTNNLGGRPSGNSASRVTLIADTRGHFVTTGTINGATVRFLVDTGATMVSMGVGDARRIGLNYLAGERGVSRTANGVAAVYRVKLDDVRVGDIALSNIDALVHEADMPWVLLGMSFLNRLEMTRQGDDLTLVKRY
jgi:aspartyl protease family protein